MTSRRREHRKPRKKGQLLQKLALALCSVFLTLAAVEVTLRILEPRSDPTHTSRVLPSGMRYIHLIKSTKGVVLGRETTINAHGFRGELRPYEKPESVTRVSVFGDSHTFGTGASDHTTYPAVLEKLLNEGDRGREFQVLNFGVGGQDLSQILYHARQHAFRYESDIVLITIHQGDIISSDIIVDHAKERPATTEKKESTQKERSTLYGIRTSLQQHSYLMRFLLPKMAALLRRHDVDFGKSNQEYLEIANNGAIWRKSQENLRLFRDECRQRKVALGIVLFPAMMDFAHHPGREAHRLLARWCGEHNISVVDLLAYFEGEDAGTLHASLLDTHPDERGYGIAARGTNALMEQILAQLNRRRPTGAE